MQKTFQEVIQEIAKEKTLSYDYEIQTPEGKSESNYTFSCPQEINTMIAKALINKALTGDLDAIKLYSQIINQNA